MKSSVEFTTGQKMPIVGLGLSMRNPADLVGSLETSMNAALEAGYRHFDTAYMYKNEEIVGNIMKKWLDSGKLKREELFITTKLPLIGMQPGKVEHFLKKSLTALQLKYVDLYLVHAPIGLQYISDTEMHPEINRRALLDKTTDLEAIWKAMELEVDAGRAKAIGISNYNAKQVERTVKIARIHPENIQVELNVYFQQKALREVCLKHQITVCAFGPLGSPGRMKVYESRGLKKELPDLLNDPIVLQISNKYNKSPGQILLRFLVQQNIVVIPKSEKPSRLKQNIDILDFEFLPEDMLLLESLDKGEEGRTFHFDSAASPGNFWQMPKSEHPDRSYIWASLGECDSVHHFEQVFRSYSHTRNIPRNIFFSHTKFITLLSMNEHPEYPW